MEDDRAEVDLGIAADIESQETPEPALKQPKKRFVGRRTAAQTAASKNGSGAVEDAGAVQGTVCFLISVIRFIHTDTLCSRKTQEGTSLVESGPS